jgi:adenosylcobyric acid synthase
MTGLGLLPIRTEMQADKVTRLCSGVIHRHSLFGRPVRENLVAGYEIHVGKTLYQDHAEPFATLEGGEPDGCISSDSRVLGTYLHGLFDHDGFRHHFLTAARTYYKLAPPPALNPWMKQREESLDRLARQVSTSLDMQRIFAWVGLKYE